MNAVIRTLKPHGIPDGLDPREWRIAVQRRVNELLDQSMALITALDVMEAGSCELEDDERESDDSDNEYSGDEHEPSLGWTNKMNQNAALFDARSDVTFFDGEQDAGDEPELVPDVGETITWETDQSQEVLVSL